MSVAPRVSVVIPCYNQGRFLGAAIESVGLSSVRDVEVLVVDDGSSDDTPDVARAAGVTCLRQGNAGLARARNRGLDAASGTMIVFLDADDLLMPGALDIGVEELSAHPDCALVFGRCNTIDPAGRIAANGMSPRIERDHYLELLRQNYIWMPALAMLRRDAATAAGGFDPSVNAAADYQLYLHLARKKGIYDHARPTALYRRHDTNMSRNSALMLRESLTVLRRQRPFVSGDRRLEAAYRDGVRHWREYYGDELVDEIRADVRSRRWLSALRKGLTLAKYHPAGMLHHAQKKAVLAAGGEPRTRSG
jgi:glycosyltransferase involved in cell wall biosynthesis